MTEPAKPLPLTDAEIDFLTGSGILFSPYDSFVQRCSLTIDDLRRQVAELAATKVPPPERPHICGGPVSECDAECMAKAYESEEIWQLRKQAADLTARNAALVEALKSAQRDLCAVVCGEHSRPFRHQPMCTEAQAALAKAQEGA